MIVATTFLVLALGVPAETADAAAPAATAGGDRAEALIVEALRKVEQRIATLEDLQRRHDAGETVSLTALRSVGRTDAVSEDALAREQARIDELRDDLRVAEAASRARQIARSERNATPAPRAVPEPEPAREEPPEVKKEAAPLVVPATVGPTELRLADGRYREEEFAGALGIYEKAAADGRNTWAMLRRARCLERLGRAKEAREAYEALVRDHPDDRWADAAQWSLRMIAIRNHESTEEEDAR